MGAIAVSRDDERRIVQLGKRLGVRSKAGVVRLAVDELERRVEREHLGDTIRTYVKKYGRLDRNENLHLSAASHETRRKDHPRTRLRRRFQSSHQDKTRQAPTAIHCGCDSRQEPRAWSGIVTRS